MREGKKILICVWERSTKELVGVTFYHSVGEDYYNYVFLNSENHMCSQPSCHLSYRRAMKYERCNERKQGKK